MYCTHCGHENPDGANFCGNCGRPLGKNDDATTGMLRIEEPAEPDADREVADAAAELAPGTALLIAVRGPNKGARFLVDAAVTSIGRHPDSDIFLDDITVSRRHAEVRRDGASFFARDVGSLNGTYVNGERAEEQRLETGDELQVGKFKLMAYLAEAGA